MHQNNNLPTHNDKINANRTRRRFHKEQTPVLNTDAIESYKKFKTDVVNETYNHTFLNNTTNIMKSKIDLMSKFAMYEETIATNINFQEQVIEKINLDNKIITRENYNDHYIICANYPVVFDEIVTKTENKSLKIQYDKYKDDEEIGIKILEELNEIFKASKILKNDPYYIWKAYYAVNLGNLLFDYIQRSDDEIMKIMNENEKMIIGKILNKNYAKFFLKNINALKYAKDMIERFIKYNDYARANSNVLRDTKKVIPNSNIFLTACKKFMREKKSELTVNDHVFICYYEHVYSYLNKYILYTDFVFDSLFGTSSINFRNLQLQPCKIKLIYLKNILIECLQNSSEDFRSFFPEVEVLIDYLKKNVEYDLYVLDNNCLYTFLFMMHVLANIAKYQWYDNYTNQTLNFVYYVGRIRKCSSYFSIKKFEIFKVISYCIIPFVETKRYNLYAQTHIIEKLTFYVYTNNPFRHDKERFNIFFNISKFNIIARNLFIYELNPINLLAEFRDVPETDKVIIFIMRAFKKSEFTCLLTAKSNLHSVLTFMQNYAKIVKKYNAYEKFIKNVEKIDIIKQQFLENLEINYKNTQNKTKKKISKFEYYRLRTEINLMLAELFDVDKNNINKAMGAINKKAFIKYQKQKIRRVQKNKKKFLD
ncbi:hypothetical protein COBT_000405 [Conglomerata obtusa]